jgi:hypothetical protein
MGASAAKGQLNCHAIKNDYELVIRVSKQLEAVLETKFRASGRGLHEKVSTAKVRQQPGPPSPPRLEYIIHCCTVSLSLCQDIPPTLERQIRFLATIRNQLIHNPEVEAIPDRPAFIAAYEKAAAELTRLSTPSDAGSSCVVS